MTMNPNAACLMEFIQSHKVTVQAVARVARMSEGGIRSFRDNPGRVPNKSTRLAIAKALHVLTQETINIVELFGVEEDAQFSVEINQDKNEALSSLLKSRQTNPRQLAKLADVELAEVVDTLQGKTVPADVADAMARALGVERSQLGVEPSGFSLRPPTLWDIEETLFNEYVDTSDSINRDSILDARWNLSIFANRSSDDVGEYMVMRGAGEDILSRPAERVIRAIFGPNSPLGEHLSLRRLYYLFYLKEKIEKEIRETTLPRLADLVRLELPLHGRPIYRESHIKTFDGNLYVRRASAESRYVEIGSPSYQPHSGQDVSTRMSTTWLDDVLAGIEDSSTVYDRIVMTDRYDSVGDADFLAVYSDRGWSNVDGNLEYKVER